MSSAPDRQLVIVRHAQAEQTAPSDAERPLTDRGRRDAAATGRWLGAVPVHPDVVLVSSALRTRETWQAVSAAAGWELEPTVDRGLYAASADTAMDLVRSQAEETRTVVVIGHNPTMSDLAQLLDDGEADPELTESMTTGFSTSTAALFSVAAPWEGLGPGGARLTAYHVGRG